ncbi:hypothetical protein HRH59_00010 [Rheinheimera sp. YQF-2]|uniref:Uncharacterized protein n=1 Tax=Rheinheimera lutimaris TaxID=2740584 RepID=A0A7Y5AM84_9GAMM|nr:hypothetical protein [Rheinheimera lutimaris]NRQ40957.1 hypothetical protein [Rheinheimera lutimaris]
MCSKEIEALAWIDDARKTINKSLLTTVPIILTAIAVPLVAMFCSALLPSSETVATWFQRSGSIVVALAVWIELKNNSISGYIYPSGLSTSDFTILKNEYRWLYLAVRWSGFFLAISGTLIWGYGDIPLNNT